MAGPPLCDACVAKYDGIVPICPIFPVPLPTNSVDSGLLPRYYSVFPYSPRKLNGIHSHIHFKWYFIGAW